MNEQLPPQQLHPPQPPHPTHDEVGLPPDVETIAVGHEPLSIPVHWVFVGGLTILVLVGLGLIVATLLSADVREDEQPRAGGPVARDLVQLQEPRLEPNQAQELQQLLSTQRIRLEGYGWVDRDRGIARVPIDRAIDILAERATTQRQPIPQEERQP